MKKLLFYVLLISTIALQAQIATNAPWMQTLVQARTTAPTLQEIRASFDSYWENHDKDKKGSGYKPFKRWEQFWSSQLDSSGHLMTREAIWQAWQQKQAMQNTTMNRNVTVTSNWTSIGPYSHNNSSSWSPGQGRVNFAIVDPNNANTYYVGTPAGGIWKSTDAGQSWTPLSDDLPQLGVSGIAIDPNDSNIIYIATGDDDAGNTYSIGVMKSTDGGTTWNTTGLIFNATNKRSNDIYINPNNSNMLWVATSDGIYKTTDAGVNWTLVLAGNCKDLKLKPNSPDTIYAVVANTFYKSIDFGETFSPITSTGMPTSTSRMAIAVTPADNTVVYLLNAASGSFEGVYKSTDSGANFTKTLETDDIFDGSGQSYYDMAITVSDTAVNTVFVGVLNIRKSTDGGDNFIPINNWSNPSGFAYTHADIHFLRYYNGVLFAGTDGGIYRSTDDGVNFTDLTVNGLAIGQFYRVSVSKDANNNVVGGLQDNGGFGYSSGVWGNYHGADGMDCAVDPNDANTYYGFIQNGNSLYVTHDGGTSGSSYVGAPTGVTGNWVTPLVANKQSVLYAGYNKLYKVKNNAFIAVSGADFGGNIRTIEIDPLDNTIIYVSRGTNLFRSIDSGVTFTNIHTFTNAISSIEVNNLDSNTIYISTSGTNGKIYKTSDNAATWTDITYNLPADSKNVVRHQNHHSANPIYVGTSLGVYYLDDTFPTIWQQFDTNLPNVSVSDLEINSYNHKITAATYGRGVWQSPISSEIASDDIKVNKIIAPSNSISCNTAITPIVEVFNNGQNDINQIDFTYHYDSDAAQTYQWNGTLTSGQTFSITLPSEILTIGNHTLNVSSTITNDAYIDNNSSFSSFKINRSDIPSTLFTFEDSVADTFITQGTAWEIASPASINLNTVSSGAQAYCIAPTADYLPNTKAYLYSPCYDLTTITSPILHFQMAFRTELDWDYLYMEYSTDGSTWQILGNASDTNWYNSASTLNGLPGKQWTGIADVLRHYSYDLAAFTAETTIQFRFVFLSDTYVQEQGVVVDDFTISSTLEVSNNIDNNITIKPNPSNGIFALSWGSDTTIKSLEIYTITGQLVKTIAHSFQANNYNLDMKGLSKGMYLLKVKSDKGEFAKKLIIQ